jgi:hypothetical protein
MVGTRPRNPHEGSRSEILADYLFSAWGTVTPVRWQDDFGVDLFCTLNELAGRAWRVKAYYTVQVKSAEIEWRFAEPDEVEWLIHHPSPLFLCAIDKKAHRARIYQTFLRFYLWANGIVPNSLNLKPESSETAGAMPEWTEGAPCSLSAPIIEVGVDDLINNERMQQLGSVLDYWIQRDRANCDRVRQGLRRFTMPPSYIVNELPASGIASMGLIEPATKDLIHRGLRCLGEAAECIGSELVISDPQLALRATLLLSWLQRHHADALNDDPFLRRRGTGHLYSSVCKRLNEAHGDSSFTLAGLEEMEKRFENDVLVKEYLRRAGTPV